MTEKNNIITIIPARMGSSRFPGKPMAEINGKPMIGHVYERAKLSKIIRETFVATCDSEIADYIHSIGGHVIMTSSSHERASDRTSVEMLKAETIICYKVYIVVMFQGDEPMVTTDMIEKSIKPFKDSDVNVVNLMSRMETIEEFEDPNEPKVVVDINSNALYFSREPIPSRKKGILDVPMYKQVCIIPFRRQALLDFNGLPETELERIESIDMNRILEHGGSVKMVLVDGNPISVDTKSDLRKVSNFFSEKK